jgi:8-oxo-dGTP diphosphatase
VLRAWWFLTRPTLEGVKCVLTDGDSVLLVRHTYGRRDWDLPGGSLRRNEDPQSAARREMEEELGVRLDEVRSLGAIQASPYRARDTVHCFQAELHSPELRLDLGELAAARWFRRDDLPVRVSRYVRSILALAS